MLLLLSLMLTGTLLALGSTQPLPNIIFIIADDLGWNDVSFHGSDQFQTPNIDALAYSGVILQDYYTQPICTPSRAALLTGRHPIHNGMNEDVIYAEEPWGLPLSERLLPQYLKEMGYATRAVGKWHLGFFRANYTPTHRGFDSHYGMWLGQQDYYSHYSLGADPGYDFHRGLNVSWEAKGKYNTDLFTEEAERVIQSHDVNRPLFLYLAHTAPHAPLQAPQEVIDTFSYIKDEKRRVFAAMVTKVDDSVGKVVEALKGKHLLNNSIVVFVTDNGGATNGYNGNCASNWPLRGCKDTLWEGGVRGVGLIWSPLLKATPRVHEGLFNVQDWVPTLLSATSSFNTTDTTGLDGVSQWRALNLETEAPYKEFLHNIDNVSNVGALRVDNWKIIYGRKYSGMFDGNHGFLEERVPYDLAKMRRSSAAQALELTSSALPQDQDILALRARATITCSSSEPIPCSPHIAPCLFDVTVDPCESRNLASEHPQVVEQLLSRLKEYQSTLAPSSYRPSDPRSDPKNWNLTWTNWGDFLNVSYDETSQH